jgi:flagella basal body P-ring formation protein FlgA
MNHTVRQIAAAALAVALLGAGSAAASTTLPLILKQRAVVEGEGVMLSDLFANVPADRDMRIADSPAPGDRLVFGARQLLHYTQTFGLPWRPRDAKVFAEVVRDSAPVPIELVREALFRAILEQQGNSEDFDVEIFNRDLPLFTATDAIADVIVRNLVFDPRSGRFDAAIMLAGSQASPAVVNGRVVSMVMIPVLRGHSMPGDVITEADIDWVRVEGRRAGTNVATRVEELVGRTPRRPVAGNQPIRLTDVQANFVIAKGSQVTIVLRSGSMTLTARAEALQRGAIGDTIRVRNNQSRRVLDVRVIGPDTVTVGGSQLAALN